jgi:hypothetical protein
MSLPSSCCITVHSVSCLKKLKLNQVRECSRPSLEAEEGFESLPLRHFHVFPTRDGFGKKYCFPYEGNDLGTLRLKANLNRFAHLLNRFIRSR